MELEEIQAELKGLLDRLDEDLEEDGVVVARPFFGSIRSSILTAESTAELLGPFQQLATAAFQGFDFGPQSFSTVNLVLDRAHAIATLLAARDVTRH